MNKVRECSLKIAVKIAEYAYLKGNYTFFICYHVIRIKSLIRCYLLKGIASAYPEPLNKEEFIRAQIYDYNYDCPLPATYSWPKEAEEIISPKSISELTGEHLKNTP